MEKDLFEIKDVMIGFDRKSLKGHLTSLREAPPIGVFLEEPILEHLSKRNFFLGKSRDNFKFVAPPKNEKNGIPLIKRRKHSRTRSKGPRIGHSNGHLSKFELSSSSLVSKQTKFYF